VLRLAALVLSSLILTGVAHAQEGTEVDLSDQEAHNLFEAGLSAYQDGRFEAALGHFQNAYELSDRPALLFNIGSCLDRLRRDAEAVDYFERFLEAVPDAPNRTEVEGRIRILRRAVADRAEDGSGGETSETEEAEGSGGLLWTWVSLAAAAAFGGVAIGTWVAGNGEEESLRQGCGAAPPGCTDDEVSTLQTLDTLTNVFLFTAIGAAALSVVLFFVEGSGGDEASAALRISPVGAELRGRF
jgi:tetratricopeptide (TPR) repeat protein